MITQFERFNRLYGKNSSSVLSDKNVIIFGVGGVGSFTAEALIRSGLGNLTIVDNDIVELSNLNRQIQATYDTIGMNKAEALRDRLLTINPKTCITVMVKYFDEKSNKDFEFKKYDYVIDAIDSIKSKILLIEEVSKSGVPIISSMGAGNKFDPTRFRISDIEDTKVCPLARIIRKEVRDRNIKGLKVVWSDEVPVKITGTNDRSPGSSAFVPPVAGLIIASEVVKELLKEEKYE